MKSVFPQPGARGQGPSRRPSGNWSWHSWLGRKYVETGHRLHEDVRTRPARADRPAAARSYLRARRAGSSRPRPSPIHRRSPHRSPSRRARSRGRHRLGGFRTRRRRCRPSITPKPPAATDSRTSRRASDAKIASNTSSSSARTRSRRAKSPPRGVLRRVSCFRESIRDTSRGKTLTAPPSQLRGGKGETLALPPGGAGQGVLGQIRHDGPAASIDLTGFSRGK